MYIYIYIYIYIYSTCEQHRDKESLNCTKNLTDAFEEHHVNYVTG